MIPASPLILAVGDSLIAGYGLRPADSLPAQLEARLRRRRPAARVINAGQSGDTTGGLLRRLPAVLSRLDHRPELAIVQIGPNDVLRQIEPARMRADLDAILLEFERCAVPVLLTIVAPPPILASRAGAYLGIHEAAAARHGARTCAFFPADVLGHPQMVLPDRVHPNAAAIARVADALLPAVEQALAPAGDISAAAE
ncbi:MAG TPA: GDSL-type esterase/lipase family protein [Sphingomonas sp.]|nr:GDSL-type esterase/lipase family protein [Sphingomonas sp.]